VAAVHGTYIKSRTPLHEVKQILKDHNCDHCPNCITVFNPAKSLVTRRREANVRAVRKYKNTRIHLNNMIPLATQNTQYNKKSDQVPDAIGNEEKFPPSPLRALYGSTHIRDGSPWNPLESIGIHWNPWLM
jgi:hypothetical protein